MPSDTDHGVRAAVARKAARAGAAVAYESFRTDLDVETKTTKTDVVTQADRDAQTAVIELVRERFPDDAIVGEEEDERKTVPDEGAAWVIDPIDGTSNFVRRLRLWGTAVAATIDGDPVASAFDMPVLGDTYTADDEGAYLNGDPITVSDRRDPRECVVTPTMWWGHDVRDQYARATRAIVERFGDLRRYGSAQATLAFLASGAIDGVVTNIRPHPWDSVAGVHAVRKAGGTVTDLNGDPWRHDSVGLVASNGHVHDAVLEAARAIDAP